MRWAFIATALVGLTAGCSRSDAPQFIALEALVVIRDALDEARAGVGAPGAILGVRLRDGTAGVVSAGEADVATGRPMEPHDPFYLGSVSKTYTASLILKLAEVGMLGLDDPLSRWLPSFPRGDVITVRHLLEHTSGLKDFYQYLYLRPSRDEMIELVTRDYSQDELLLLAQRFGHWFDPGDDWAYSSNNYYLLGVVAERASGLPLPDAYRTHLFEPLGLTRTWLTLYEVPRDTLRATGYMGPVNQWVHSASFGDPGPTTIIERSNAEWGAGGLAAPALDAMAFVAALFEGRVVSADALALMRQFRATPPLGMVDGRVPPDAASGYGMGLIRMRRESYEAQGHGGLFAGHTAGVWHLPACGVTVALYLNRGFVSQRAALDRVVLAIAEAIPEARGCHPPA